MERTGKEATLNKAMPYIKAAAVVAYFMFYVSWAWSSSLFMWADGLIGFIPMGILAVATAFYGLTWLSRWVLADAPNKMHWQSIIYTLSLLAFGILLDVVHVLIGGGGREVYGAYLFYMLPLRLLYMIVAIVVLFFVFEKRKFVLTKRNSLQLISILCIFAAAVCIIVLLANTKPVPSTFPDELTAQNVSEMFRKAEQYAELFRTFAALEAATGLSLFVLFWINTKPKEENTQIS